MQVNSIIKLININIDELLVDCIIMWLKLLAVYDV